MEYLLKLANEIYPIIQDYEVHDGVRMSTDRVLEWINKFEDQDRIFILEELKPILSLRYLSEAKCVQYLEKMLKTLSRELKYGSVNDFLDETHFLDLQPDGKSQKALLEQLKGVLKDKLNYEFVNCGRKKIKNVIYLDDILCSGKTLIDDISEWILGSNSKGVKRLEIIKRNNIRIISSYYFVHSLNYNKKIGELKFRIGDDVRKNTIIYYEILVDNYIDGQIFDILMPIEEGQPTEVKEYQNEIATKVDKYLKEKGYPASGQFYRKKNQPPIETFFSSADNRIRFENILLRKGIEVLRNTYARLDSNLRALGRSYPSYKDFGFGTLCFTWRNVPNNTPVVFWHKGGGFFPLFEKKSYSVPSPF